MLTVIRDALGDLTAVCEWWCVDDLGQWKPNGLYVYVNDLELNPDVDGKSIIKELIRLIADAVPWAIAGYWEREVKYGTTKLHAFRRERLLKEEVTAHG